jgi:glycosyltransferase involved in cell wall biosynthesis
MSDPLISVLMPAYNAERYVAEAVRSILDQSFGDFEFVIIDDGSTDRTRAILERFAARDGRIRLVSRPNRGLVATLNEGLGLARGELIARMDADDVALPDRFEHQVAFLREHPEVVCLGGAYLMIDAKGWVMIDNHPPEEDREIQEELLKGVTCLIHPAAMMRRDAVRAAGGYDERMEQSEDLDLWLRLGERGRLANLHQVVLKYRIHGGSKNELYMSEQDQYAKACCDRAAARRGIESRYLPPAPWRPAQSPSAKHTLMAMYGWWSFRRGNRATALHFGLQSIRSMPWKSDGWRLLACSLIKPMKGHA